MSLITLPVHAFDAETWLMTPGCKAPPLVCLQWQTTRGGRTFPAEIRHRAKSKCEIEAMLADESVMVGHNVAFDMAVICAQWPDLIPAVFAKYNRDQVTDTKIREQLIQIAKGAFRYETWADGEPYAVTYHLDACIRRHFDRDLAKDGWRMFYRVFDTVEDLAEWPRVAAQFQANFARIRELYDWCRHPDITPADVAALRAAKPDEPLRYALGDAENENDLFWSQERAEHEKPGVFDDQFRQARAAFALQLSSCWGLYTDPESVDYLQDALLDEFQGLKEELQQTGLIRKDGTADTKRAMAAMEAACAEAGLPVLRTEKGKVSLSSEACSRFEDDSLVGLYSAFVTLRRTVSSDLKMLRAGGDVPIQPSYGLADTGRTTCADPNIQAVNKGAGIRETFVPREGHLFAQADYEGLELHTMAAWCLEVIGYSKLADDLNAGVDPLLAMAAELLGIEYSEALARKKRGDPEIKEYRQRSKAIMYGLPGGLGAPKFVKYAKNTFGVVLTEAEAKSYKSSWLRRYPEFNEFFRLAAQACATDSRLGNERHIFTGRFRGNTRYAAICNGRFQGLGADAAKEALWRVTEACYTDRTSVLFGARVVAFVHDEIILECLAEKADACAKELGRLMINGANKYLGRVPVRLSPQVMAVWSKSAEPVFDAEDKLIPWSPMLAGLIEMGKWAQLKS